MTTQRITDLWKGLILLAGILACLLLPSRRDRKTRSTIRAAASRVVADMSPQDAREWFNSVSADSSVPPYPARMPPVPADRGTYASVGERHAVQSLETIYPGHRFPKIRPNWLKNPDTGRNLELDGYNAELKLGIEYNGAQHDVWPNGFHQTRADFEHQQTRDATKRRLCRQHKVTLLVVPSTVPLERVPQTVYALLLDHAAELSLRHVPFPARAPDRRAGATGSA